jgi:acylphosphatase
VVVEGRVQGVGYRMSCARRARDAGLAGGVRNRPDGRVEAVFEGDPEMVDSLVEWCGRGPVSARVTRVLVSEEPVRGERDFRVG